MHLSMPPGDLASYLGHQLTTLFPDPSIDAGGLKGFVDVGLQRAEHCFSRIRSKYFANENRIVFDHLMTDQYAAFLYFVANSVHRGGGERRLASAVYALNKALHGLDAFFEVELPDVFLFQHPVGTVLGRATYHDYFVAYQRVSVGANLKDVYPVLGPGVVMYGGSSVIGSATVGANCWFSVGATVMDEDIPRDTVVFGCSPDLVLKPTNRDVRADLFGEISA